VTVHELKRKVLPPLDDEFAKDYGGCTTLNELRERIRTRLEHELKEIQEREMKEQILTQLIAANPFEVPTTLIEEQLRYLVERRRVQLAERPSVPSREKSDLDPMRLEMEPQARRQVQAMLLVEEIARMEKIDVSEDEVQTRVDELALAAKEQGKTVRALYQQEGRREDLRSQMIFGRTLDFLLKHAQVRELER
jgi:trigger factor